MDVGPLVISPPTSQASVGEMSTIPGPASESNSLGSAGKGTEVHEAPSQCRVSGATGLSGLPVS
jgi:hypothetical protein